MKRVCRGSGAAVTLCVDGGAGASPPAAPQAGHPRAKGRSGAVALLPRGALLGTSWPQAATQRCMPAFSALQGWSACRELVHVSRRQGRQLCFP